MAKQLRLWIVGAALMTIVAYGAIQQIRAADDDQDITAAIQKMAQNLESHNDNAASAIAKKMPSDLDPGDVMSLLDKRHANGKGGLGIDKKPNTGIETMVQKFAKQAPTQSKLNRDYAALRHAAYIIVASAKAIHNHCPVKAVDGKKNPKDWLNWSTAMDKQGSDFAKAIESKNPQKVKRAASNLNDTCTKCHEVFKD
jgi:cytochrome c556